MIDHSARRGTKIEFSQAEAIRYNECSTSEHSKGRLLDEFSSKTLRGNGDADATADLMFGILARAAYRLS